MKKIYSFATLIYAFTFLSFSQADGQTTGKIQPAKATTISLSETFDIDGILNNPCTGEDVHFSGKVHMNVHGTMNGNKVTSYFHFNAQNIIGTGLTSGNHYIGNQSETYIDNHPMVGEKITFAYAFKFKMVSSSNLDNLIMTENFHITVNADGRGTAIHGDTIMECH